MKILYLTDSYANKVAGIKTSIYNWLTDSGVHVDLENIHSHKRNVVDGKKLLKQVSTKKYTHVFMAHTWVSYCACTLKDINALGASVLGFGFSDPYGWNWNRLNNYNYYCTHSYAVYEAIKRKSNIPVFHFKDSCDTRFHKDTAINKTIDVSFMGIGIHPHFKDVKYRIKTIQTLLNKGVNIKVFGKNWGSLGPTRHLTGNEFLKVINCSKLGIDLQEKRSSVSHRLFEYMACGVPVITRNRSELYNVFNKNDILVYDTVEDLYKTITRLLQNKDVYNCWKQKMYTNVITNHTMKNRINEFLKWIHSQKLHN